MEKSFYHYILTFRGGDWSDEKTRFAEAAFEDSAFPKTTSSFEELSHYIEMQSNEFLTISAFDALWALYEQKYGL